MIVHNYYLRDARVRRYAEALAAEGQIVDVYCLIDSNEAQSKDESSGVSIYRVPVTRRRSSSFIYIFEYALSFTHFAVRLTSHHLHSRYDLIHIHNMPDILIFTAMVPRLMGTPVILDLHDLMPEVYMSKHSLQTPDLVTKLLRVLENLATRFASSVITSTKTFKDRLVARGVPPDKITVVVNAPDLGIFNPGMRKVRRTAAVLPDHDRISGSFRLMYVGTIADRYGLDIAIQGLALLKEHIPRIHLEIICKISQEGTGLDQLMHQVRRLKVGSHLTIHDPVPLQEVPLRMLTADAAIYPARDDVHMDVALSLKIPEFVAMGVPVIATRLSVLEHYFGQTAMLYFPDGDTKAFTAQVLRLYRGEVNVEDLIAAADQFLTDWSWEAQKRLYFDLIAHLLHKQFLVKPGLS